MRDSDETKYLKRMLKTQGIKSTFREKLERWSTTKVSGWYLVLLKTFLQQMRCCAYFIYSIWQMHEAVVWSYRGMMKTSTVPLRNNLKSSIKLHFSANFDFWPNNFHPTVLPLLYTKWRIKSALKINEGK